MPAVLARREIRELWQAVRALDIHHNADRQQECDKLDQWLLYGSR